MTAISFKSVPRQLADGDTEFEIPGECDLKELLSRLVTSRPKLGRLLFTTDGSVNPYLAVFINGTNSRYLPPEQQIHSTDRVEVIKAVVGG